MRADAIYASEACSKRARRSASPDKARTEHPLAEARAEQEASKLNDHLAQIVYNAIIDRLKVAGDCHADDLEDYFPDEHRDRCRKLVPGQLGSLRGRKFIQPTSEYRKSKVPARKCAKSWVYVFTQKGRATLVGVGAGVPESVRPEEVTAVDLESASTSSPGPLQLDIAEPSRYQDHDQPEAA